MIQRVSSARVTVGGEVVGEIGAGLCVLLGVAQGDDEATANRLAGKVGRLRIFKEDGGRLDRSLLDTGGEALVVSQFTLIADSRRQKGTRPDFSKAARPEVAEPLYEHFCQALRELGVAVQMGVFGARMEVALVNDGPVTIILDVEAHMTDADLHEFARSYTAAWCSHDPARVAEHYVSGGTIAINGGEPGQIMEVAQSFMSEFPDIQVFMEELVVRDKTVEYHWTFTGTNTGPGGTGNRVRISGYEEWAIGADGLIAESQGHYDATEYAWQIEHGVEA